MGREVGHKTSEETKRKIGNANRGKTRSFEIKKQMSETSKKFGLKPPSRKGLKNSIEHRRKSGLARKGENNNFWKGGKTEINKKIRNSLEYKLWRESVFKRDKWTCVWCGVVGGRLNADHIKPFSLYPELRLAIDNGRTLCVPCHKTTETYGLKYYNKN